MKKIIIPDEFVALRPASPRDSSRLMVIDTSHKTVLSDVFRNISNHLPKESLLVFNETKVLPARVPLYKNTGGRVTLLFLMNELLQNDVVVHVLANQMLEKGTVLSFKSGEKVEVVGQNKNIFKLKFLFPQEKLVGLLVAHGETPIPPYLRKTPLSEQELRLKYQSMFAKQGSSVAAPTASLHFTPRVMASLRKKGIRHTGITLDVGLGTFAPVGERELREGTLHIEPYQVSKESIDMLREAKRNGRPVVAVGTTVLRTLESSASKILGGKSQAIRTSTNLFIRDPYAFEVVDALVTNFHVPDSSLMYLVDAFLKYKRSPKSISELYQKGMSEKFRFYSFGDAMLIY